MHLGAMEILLVLALALLFFGPAKLPALGASLGTSMKRFKDGLAGVDPEPPSADPAGDPRP